jgi:hypothetical protein
VASTVAWLDTSADEQRRVRELIALFSQVDSRDELGVGQIRDAFSETLFPGTSVIQTRARYFLFVPWIYRDGHRRGRSGPQLKAWADARERRLIEAIRAAGDDRGLIGRIAGPAVKILPSTIYWSGLNRYRILARDAAPDQLGAAPDNPALQEADELAARQPGDWHPTLPQPPGGFPDVVAGGFHLTNVEASWLAERIATTAPDTLLSHLVQRGAPPDPDSQAPWDDTACLDAPASIREQLNHARLFSLAIHGAALLYNLVVGERYETAGYTRHTAPAADYETRLAQWADRCADAGHQLRDWNREQMWQLIHRANPRVAVGTRLFVDTWLDAVVAGGAPRVPSDDSLRRLIAQREQKHKRAQSRLTNDRLLATWSGEAGSGLLTYRWPTVHTLVIDIHEGLGRDAGS